MVVHIFNPSTGESETGDLLSETSVMHSLPDITSRTGCVLSEHATDPGSGDPSSIGSTGLLLASRLTLTSTMSYPYRALTPE